MLLVAKSSFYTKSVEGSTEREAIMKKQIRRRIETMVLIAAMLLSGMGITGTKHAEAATQQDAVNWAMAQIGKGLDYDGVYGNQCVDLIKYYYAYFGVANYARGNANAYITNNLPAGWTRVYGNYQPGDIAVWKANHSCSTCTTGQYGHVGIILSADSVGFNAVSQNTGGHDTCTKNWFYVSALACAIRPAFTGSSAPAPAASVSYSQLDTTFVDTWNAGLHGRIENPNRATISQVGVWIWDSAGNLVVDHKENCGLSTFYVEQNLNVVSEAKADGLRSGETYTYQMYAVADGATYKSGTGSFTVKDEERPVISDVQVYNITSEGYTVSCVVTDNFAVDRVQFPTWTSAGDQDDIQSDWASNSAASGTRNGNTFTYQVKISDHNNERGSYRTHIYAYDKAGNYSAIATENNIIVPEVVSVATPTPVVTPQPTVEPVVTPQPTAVPVPAVTPQPTVEPVVTPQPTVAPVPVVTPQPTKDTTVSTDDGEDDDTDSTPAEVQVTAPKKVTLQGLLSISKKTMVAYWTHNYGAYDDGYQVQYAKNKKFTKAVTKNVSISKTEIKIKKLTSKKTYYVRVRVYRNSSRGKVYSSWSNVRYCRVR